GRSSSSACTATPRPHSPRCSPAASRETTRSASAPPSPCPCTTGPPPTPSPRSRTAASPSARSAPAARPSTTSTCGSPARAAPTPRLLLVLGNLAVAFAITALQVVVLIAVAAARGIDFHASATGIVWFAAAATLFTVGMYGVAETLAGRVPKAEEYIARVPAIAIVPWFLPARPS